MANNNISIKSMINLIVVFGHTKKVTAINTPKNSSAIPIVQMAPATLVIPAILP
jgi:hypothetical protein